MDQLVFFLLSGYDCTLYIGLSNRWHLEKTKSISSGFCEASFFSFSYLKRIWCKRIANFAEQACNDSNGMKIFVVWDKWKKWKQMYCSFDWTHMNKIICQVGKELKSNTDMICAWFAVFQSLTLSELRIWNHSMKKPTIRNVTEYTCMKSCAECHSGCLDFLVRPSLSLCFFLHWCVLIFYFQ